MKDRFQNNSSINFLFRITLFLIGIACIVNGENRIIFTDVGLSCSRNFNPRNSHKNSLIGDLKIGYTTKKQEADLSLQCSFDFLHGVDKSSFEYDDEHIFPGDTNSIEHHETHGYIQEKRAHVQLAMCSDVYINNFFIRISPQFNFWSYSKKDRQNTIYAAYTIDTFVPYDTSYTILSSTPGFEYYPGFLVGLGYAWKRCKMTIFNSNVTCVGVCFNYTLYEIKRKTGAPE